VVEFETDAGKWVANFSGGLGRLRLADLHPNQRDAVVVTDGDLWVVELESRQAQRLLPAIDFAIDVDDPPGWIFSRQGLAFARLGPKGLLWHTRRLSVDGFDQVRIEGDRLTGLACFPADDWRPFSVDVRSGKLQEGADDLGDTEGWEALATDDGRIVG
jgi:hypothetical protein